MTKITKNEQTFSDILDIINHGQNKVYNVVRHVLLDTYWSIGKLLSDKSKEQEWGKSTVEELSRWLKAKSTTKGFSTQNLWRMRQFYDLYHENSILSPLVRELGWTQNCIIMAQCKTPEEQEYYLKTSIAGHWSKRTLEQQIKLGSFERTMLSDAKLSPVVRDLPQDVTGVFKDSYVLDFLEIPEQHLEKDLQSALVANLRQFLLELGTGFTFIGEKVRLQVGKKDFELDLLFYHRDLQCMVVFELKTGDFEPSHLGQLAFYLEALDREQKRPNENPTIGVLLCRSKDDEVVELALHANLSPALVAEYQSKLIPKDALKKRLHDWRLQYEHKLNDNK